MYTSIYDNSTISLAIVKKHLRLDEDDTYLDTIITIALGAAKIAADNYCQDTFDPVPEDIEWWILKVLSLEWEKKAPMVKAMEYKDLGSIDWEFNYDDYFHWLKPRRREVGFGPF